MICVPTFTLLASQFHLFNGSISDKSPVRGLKQLWSSRCHPFYSSEKYHMCISQKFHSTSHWLWWVMFLPLNDMGHVARATKSFMGQTWSWVQNQLHQKFMVWEGGRVAHQLELTVISGNRVSGYSVKSIMVCGILLRRQILSCRFRSLDCVPSWELDFRRVGI